MTSAPPSSPTVEAAAARLCPASVRRVEAAGGGGNSRLYRVTAGDGRHYALKVYPPSISGPGSGLYDRLGREAAALAFISRHDPMMRVPIPVAADAGTGHALFSWIDGAPVAAPSDADIDDAVDFARLLHGLRAAPGAGDLPLATEACLSLAEIAAQIERRWRRLEPVAVAQPTLRACLEEGFTPLFPAARARAEAFYRDAGLSPGGDLEPAQRTLSPSDFGFHNALRRADGRLVFLDFEYFGWDDPVRLTADVVWHPGMSLEPRQAARFVAGTGALFAGDPAYSVRVAALWPLVGLRWSMILLNEFLPERWAARVHAGEEGERRTVLARQVSKAWDVLKKVKRSMRYSDVSAFFLGNGHDGE